MNEIIKTWSKVMLRISLSFIILFIGFTWIITLWGILHGCSC